MSLSDISGNIIWFSMQKGAMMFSDPFLIKYRKSLSVSDTLREGTWALEILKYVCPDVGVREIEEGGMPIAHIVSLKTLDTELQATVPARCAPL